jgi:hypothetical protein
MNSTTESVNHALPRNLPTIGLDDFTPHDLRRIVDGTAQGVAVHYIALSLPRGSDSHRQIRCA